MKAQTEFFDTPITDLPDDVVSETFHTIHEYRLKCVKRRLKMKRKWKVEERWFCLPEGAGEDLPRYVREGASYTGFKSYNNFFAMAGYYRSKDIAPRSPRVI